MVMWVEDANPQYVTYNLKKNSKFLLKGRGSHKSAKMWGIKSKLEQNVLNIKQMQNTKYTFKPPLMREIESNLFYLICFFISYRGECF